MAHSDAGADVESLTTLHWVGIIAATVSGIVHAVLGVLVGGALGISFFVATLGFGAGVAAIVAGYRRRLMYAVGIPFTGGQIVLWYVINFVTGTYSFPADVGVYGAVDKVAQVALIAVLAVLLSRES
ncbi:MULTISPECIES: hypothetical protein [Halorubrum]|jgi:hypothetical protein|uniref:Histidine kinase n=1 Tax=Halorubrum tropicale TaxID=1765655 RepID=A0A0M9ASS3_9EURY|nr:MULTISPECIES: hypothetical protein [Halorubrum]KOX97075.1 hypothetical protein AMR74_06520 [Halorubrum tropicale]RLM51612.1 hypothetical protein DVK06_04225 [Halorubrum sp. Atlit-28R]TKX46207.1 hypothetical protein EXE50_03115 [Halorubrum sp. ARQ200]TKX49215.1 hypothetical protein EXE49_12615 [Halorubrum sp. ASP121]TKX59184.1 hypothetical protein EXE48_15465 [Halorubrum sp. ASP1]